MTAHELARKPMTAHELARKLLAGGDYTVVTGSASSGLAFSLTGVKSENALGGSSPVMVPVVTLFFDHWDKFETFAGRLIMKKDLSATPELLLDAVEGDDFRLDGHTFIVEGHPDGIFLTSTAHKPVRSGTEYTYIHLRTAAQGDAVMSRQAMVDMIRTRHYEIS